jgi:hypothetical protein
MVKIRLANFKIRKSRVRKITGLAVGYLIDDTKKKKKK